MASGTSVLIVIYIVGKRIGEIMPCMQFIRDVYIFSLPMQMK